MGSFTSACTTPKEPRDDRQNPTESKPTDSSSPWDAAGASSLDASASIDGSRPADAGGRPSEGSAGVRGDGGKRDDGGSHTARGGNDASREGSSGGAAASGGATGDGGSPETLPLTGEPCAGYTLISNSINDRNSVLLAKLIDMDGNVVHEWDLTGFPAKMMPGGSLIGCMGIFPGSYDCVDLQQVGWDGTLEWSFSNWADATDGSRASRQHHDFLRQGNPHGTYAPGQDFRERGTTLVLAHVNRDVPEVRAGTIEDDVIYEVDWAGELTGFLWYGADHYDEFGFDEAAWTDIRTREPDAARLEWLHGNSISRLGPNVWYDSGERAFHPENILYSSRSASVVAILSHETGELVWRIGPDFTGRPEEQLGQFSGQHNPYMIPKGLPGAGNVLVFDNGGPSGYGGTSTTGLPNRWSRDYSRVVEFDPTTFEVVWEYGSDASRVQFYSYLISNAQRLPNGNTLITVGMDGHLLEVTPDHRVVWEFQAVPDSSPIDAARVYRAYRVPPEWLPEGENAALGNYATWASLFEGP
jgi:hypothetical protein